MSNWSDPIIRAMRDYCIQTRSGNCQIQVAETLFKSPVCEARYNLLHQLGAVLFNSAGPGRGRRYSQAPGQRGTLFRWQ